MKLFAGSSNKPLAQKIANHLKLPLSPLEIHIFPDGERRIQIQEPVVGEDCVVVEPTSPPVDGNYMELFFIVDGLKRSGAKSVTAVVAYIGYQRQDHVFRDGEAVSLDVVIKTLEANGVDKFIAFDFHSIKIPELFHLPVIHLSALPLFAKKIKELVRGRLPHTARDARSPMDESFNLSHSLSESRLPTNSNSQSFSVSTFSSLADGQATPLVGDQVLISPDMGGVRRIKILSELLDNMPYAAIVKNRDLATGSVSSEEIEGDLTGAKTAFIVDDMISSGKTIDAACSLLQNHGVEQMYVFATHAIFSKDAPSLLQNCPAEKVFVTDTVFIPPEKHFAKLEILSVADMIAEKLQELSY